MCPYTHVKAHYSHRGRKKFKVKAHARKTVGSLARGRSGKKFRRLREKVAKSYTGKEVPKKYRYKYGKRYSKAEAEKVGTAVAGKVFWKKFGGRSGKRILKRER